ncbi:MAG: cytochrome P450 [Deltaproteobacteria bacterium]|nr:cytochrome P450 [Deltaproteobacteria bacterium]
MADSRPSASRLAVEPMPPTAKGGLPWIGAGLGLLRNPTEFFRRTRQELGDTYLVDAFGWRLFCVFSPEGVRRLYALPEDEASFGLATFNLLRAKVPLEVFQGRRNRPHDLFGNQEVERYLGVLEESVRLEIEQLGASGAFEVFREMRRLGHRLGLGAWAGTEAASSRYLDRLIPLFDRLDSSEAFVRPLETLLARATRQVRERRALHGIESVIGEILAARGRERERDGGRDAAAAAESGRPPDFLDQIRDSFADLPPGEREVQVARDVILLHMGAQSNLYAGLAWTFVNVLKRPEILAAVRGGDDVLLERCANESIRLAQRSITLRQVLRPVEVDDGKRTYRVPPGVLIATMLSVTNDSSAPGLERFDPEHYDGRRLAGSVPVPARELVSTFGHGRHSCPAQRFAISAIRIAVRRLLERYDFTLGFDSAEPRRRQLGGVARAERPCPVTYRRRG